MADKCDDPIISFKRGDDFKLDFTVQDTNKDSAVLLAAELVEAKTVLTAAENADPVIPQDVIDAQAVVDAAQAAYDADIIIDITGWTMVSQARRGQKLIQTMTIVVIDAPTGRFSITADDVDTVNWPIQKLDCDIEFTRPTGKVSSQTFIIDVKRDVTR